jgi:hypothetical protein
MNYLCWWRGLKGPYAALHLLDPRSMMSWKEQEDRCIAIVTLKEDEQNLTLDQAVAKYPCPMVSA